MRPSVIADVLPRLFEAKMPVLLKGPPGCAKTSLVDQATQRIKHELIVSHPVVDDPTDYKGMPFAVDGQADFLPFGNLRKLLMATVPTVFFLDDLGQAPQAVQAAAMQLILAREINGQRVSDYVTFAAATNRKEDRAGVSGILEPVKSRFVTIIDVEPNPDDWLRWARRNKLPEELLMLIKWRPELLSKFTPTADMTNSCSPRTIHNVAKLYDMGFAPEEFAELCEGAAGQGFALEFTGFLKKIAAWPDLDQLLASPATFNPPNDPGVLYALSAIIAKRITKANFGNIMKLIERLDKEWQVLCVKAAADRDRSVVDTKAYGDWAANNVDVLI